MFIDTAVQVYYPDPRNLRSNCNSFIDKYNLSAYGFIDARYAKNLQIDKLKAKPPDGAWQNNDKTYNGTQGRYYLTGFSQDKADTIDFANVFQASGCYFIFDYARRERRWGNTDNGH